MRRAHWAAAATLAAGILCGAVWLVLFMRERGLDEADKLGGALGLFIGPVSIMLALIAIIIPLTLRQNDSRSPAVESDPLTVKKVVPAQLPADVSAFTGRTEEMTWLFRAVESPDADGVLSVSVVAGMPGVGKTALVVHWAHRVRELFPDGQLYVDLRGYDPERPMSPHDALARFLGALGVAGVEIPLDPGEREAAYRSSVSGRRLLIVLDNARDVEQLRPLLPGSGSCLVVVTSRDSMIGLVARHGARRLNLEVLPAKDAVHLLRRLIGPRVEHELVAARRLAAHCACLPLALRVVAERAAGRAHDRLDGIADELADEHLRLRAIDVDGDRRTAVTSVFSWSLREAPPEVARGFRLIGLHPAADFDSSAAAALIGVPLPTAQVLLARLVGAHLLRRNTDGRHTMHDLLRAYARQQATSAEASDGAIERLLDYYLTTAAAAMDVLHPAERDRRPPATTSPWTAPVGVSEVALRWLDAERATLVTVVRFAAERGWPRRAITLVRAIARYLDTGGHNPEAIVLHTIAHDAAVTIGDPAGQAEALHWLGAARFRVSDYQQALELFGKAVAIFAHIGDRRGELMVLNSLGLVSTWQGYYDEATGYYRRSLDLAIDVGDRVGEARAFNNLATIDERHGRYVDAATYYQKCMALFGDIGDQFGLAHGTAGLGHVYVKLGRHSDAEEHLRRALALFRQLGDRAAEAATIGYLGDAQSQLGEHSRAIECFREAVEIVTEIGDPGVRAALVHRLGDAMLASDQISEAETEYSVALTLAVQITDRYEMARAYTGLGRSHRATGQLDQARHYYTCALNLYSELGLPEAAEIEATLGTLSTM